MAHRDSPSVLRSFEFRAGALSGLLCAISVPPSPLGFLGYVCLVPLLILLFSPERVRDGMRVDVRRLALSFGLVRYVILLHWLVMLGDASPLSFKWAMPLLLLVLALYLTIGDLILFWVSIKLRDVSGVQAIWWWPGLWVVAEWLRAVGDMGFPWLRLASTQLAYRPMLQIGGVFGELGVTLFVVWVNVLIALSWLSFRSQMPGIGRAVLSRWWAPVTLVLLFVGQALYGQRTIARLDAEAAIAEPFCVGVAQANVDLMDKWDPAKRDSTYVPYADLTRKLVADGARLVIWGETAVPFDLPRNPAGLERVRQIARGNGVEIFMGFPERVVRGDGLLDAFNSSVLMDEAGVLRERYRKRHLLAFGERLPFQDLIPAIGEIDFGQAEWAEGTEQTVFETQGHRFGALICFESIFSAPAREAVALGAQFLVNISNDGWFGDTVLPYQHASMAVMRAVENRVPLVRCANNGISFWVDATGRVSQRTGLFERASFNACLRPRNGDSVYTRYGDAPLFALLSAGVLFLLLIRWLDQRRL